MDGDKSLRVCVRVRRVCVCDTKLGQCVMRLELVHVRVSLCVKRGAH